MVVELWVVEVRGSDTRIHQQGSRFGPAHVSGGVLFQGNAVGVTISEHSLAVTALPLTPLILTKRRHHCRGPLRLTYAGQFVHSTLEPVKAYVPRDRLHASLAGGSACC